MRIVLSNHRPRISKGQPIIFGRRHWQCNQRVYMRFAQEALVLAMIASVCALAFTVAVLAR